MTSSEAPFPPADPLPVFVAPSVTDPVSNLDFLPVDDAFALEMRAETIEQLVGGDALRRGESERIEVGRSQINADRVAGRDRVRVHGTLREHTGHAHTEQAAHLHTTVEGTLDVHAASEDTVLLAGPMRELWDGGAAIVAAMTDDTVAGGGIRVTAPLDLWVHAVMGVEERIGTCTADAVLMELGATHYEREYGPGAHAAGLAVYTGSLYQSSRSTFRPLMRVVSSGVRNLIAGGGGGGGGGDAGAGGAPGASPPPATAQTGAVATSVTVTLAAGRRAAEGPAATLDAADGLTGAQRAPLEELVNSIDARAGEEMGGAGTVVRAQDLPELTRCADTAERLGALRETLRIDGTESANEAAGGFRASELEGAVSKHPSSGGGGPLEITPPSAVHGENAPMVRPHPDVAWGQGPETKLGLLGGADRPPQSAAPESDFDALFSRLRDLRARYDRFSAGDISHDIDRAIDRTRKRVAGQFVRFGGSTRELEQRRCGITTTEHGYLALQKMARRAERDAEFARAAEIRKSLYTIDERTIEELQWLLGTYDIAEAPSTRAMQPPPATAESTVTVAAMPPPAHTPTQFDWITAYRQLWDLTHQFLEVRWDLVHADFRSATHRISNSIVHGFRKLGGHPALLLPSRSGATKAEQAYRVIQDMARQATESGDTMRANEIRQALEVLNQVLTGEMEKLTTKHGVLDALSTQATEAMQTMRTIRTKNVLKIVQAEQIMQTKQTIQAVQAAQTMQTIRTMQADQIKQIMQTMQAAQAVQTMQIIRTMQTDQIKQIMQTMQAAQAVQLPPARVGPTTSATPPVTVASTTVAPAGRLGITVPAHPELPGGLVPATDVPGPPSASGLPGPSLAEAAGAQVGGLGLGRLDPPSTVSGATAAHPAAVETIVTPSLAETSSFWLHPVDPVPAPGSVRLDSGLHRAGETVRPPGMSAEPQPVAFDPWLAPPGPSSRVVYTETIRTPVMSTGDPPGWQVAETPGFARAASGAVELPFSRREEIARRFGTEDALLEAELALQTGGAGALGWSTVRWRAVLGDLYRLRDAIVQSDAADAAAMVDVDWSAIEALEPILGILPPSP